MKTLTFEVNYALEADSMDVIDRYTFSLSFTDEEYAHLKDLYKQNEENLDGHTSEWPAGDPLFVRINTSANRALHQLVREHQPDFYNGANIAQHGFADVYWKLQDIN